MAGEGRSIYSVDVLDKGMIQLWAGWSRLAQDFLELLRMTCDLKVTHYFWNFPFNILDCG